MERALLAVQVVMAKDIKMMPHQIHIILILFLAGGSQEMTALAALVAAAVAEVAVAVEDGMVKLRTLVAPVAAVVVAVSVDTAVLVVLAVAVLSEYTVIIYPLYLYCKM